MFDAYYFKYGCGEPYQRSKPWFDMFNYVADHIIREINPGSVLDAGCALGILVEVLRGRGVEAWGMDISEYAIENVHDSIKSFCSVGSITDPLPRRYDLIVTIEVLEHLEPEHTDLAIKNLCQASDDILFSSSPLDYNESTHYNVQMPEAWAEAFARHGFYRDVDFDASFLTPWAIRFRRKTDPPHRLIRDYERKFWPLYKGTNDLRNGLLVAEQKLRHSEKQIEDQNQQIQSQQAYIEELNRHIESQQQQIDELERLLQEQKNLIQVNERNWQERWDSLENSYSWRAVQIMKRIRTSLAPENSGLDKVLQAVRRGQKK